MNRLSCIHLNTDFSMGGVTKALGIFDHADLAEKCYSRVVPIDPARVLAPRLDADFIFNHTTPNWAALPFLFILRWRHPKAWLVHIEHSYTANWEAHNVADKGRFRTMLKLAYSNFDEIVAVSNGQRDWLVRSGIAKPSKVRVIPPWSGTQGLNDLQAANPSAQGPLRLGAMGRFDAVKGFDTLIKAFKLLPQDRFELVLGGIGPEDIALRRLAKGMPNIRFAGLVTKAADFYRQCDAVVVPSKWEAFGLVAAEARMAGRPILVANVDGLPEQAASGGVIADCSTPERLADAITEFAHTPLDQLARKARSSMACAETSRVNAWLALIGQARLIQTARGTHRSVPASKS